MRIDEAQAAVVRDLFVWYADEGATILALIRRLARLGITSPKGCPTWSPSALRGLLTNPVYTGQVFANRGRMSPSRTRRSALLPVGRRGSTRHCADPAQWIAVARVPALITQEQFDRAAERLVYNRQMARRNNRVHPYLLRGLVSCGHCRHSCMGRQQPPAYAYYLCRTKAQRRYLAPGERCPARYIPARALEELVWADLCCVLEHPDMIAEAMERARGGHWLPQEWQARRANLQRGRASLGQQIERLTEAYLAGVVGLGEYERRRREAEARLLALEQQEQALLADAERHSETVTLATHADVFCRRVRDGLEAADFQRKRALLELLVDRVVVTDSAVEIRYVFPTGPEGEREPFCRLRTDYLEALLALEPGGRVRGLLRRARCNQPTAHLVQMLDSTILEALLAPEPSRRVRGLLRRARGHQPDGPSRPDVRLHDRARPCLRSRSQGGQDGQALGRSRGGFSTKIHLKADFDGQPLAVGWQGWQRLGRSDYECVAEGAQNRHAGSDSKGWRIAAASMMQSYASAAKLRSGGSILHCGLKAMLPLGASDRHWAATARERGPNAVGVATLDAPQLLTAMPRIRLAKSRCRGESMSASK